MQSVYPIRKPVKARFRAVTVREVSRVTGYSRRSLEAKLRGI